MKYKELEDLYKTSLWELTFSNMRIEHYQNILNEAEMLLKKKVPHWIIQKVIENWMQRWVLDISIHYYTLENATR